MLLEQRTSRSSTESTHSSRFRGVMRRSLRGRSNPGRIQLPTQAQSNFW
jgi:hypothetical protein